MLKATKRVLLLLAHPSLNHSEVNNPMFRIARQLDNVTCIDLYAEYPNYRINMRREHQRLEEHDVIIFQFPIYWYSTPALLKEWQDIVLSYGFAYGSSGNALHNKTFLCSVSAGGSELSYRSSGMFQYSMREILRPLEMMSNIVGMNYLPPLVLYSANNASKGEDLKIHLQKWRQLLLALTQDTLDQRRAKKFELLNHKLDNLIKG